MRKIMKDDNAFTGLEAAIVLIAFIVVAAVFSYVVLGAGFFTTQKSQEVVHTGVSQTSSSVEIVGNVYGLASTVNGKIGEIQFDLGLTAGGSPVDMEKTVLTYSSSISEKPAYLTFKSTSTLGNNEWCIQSRNKGDTDNLLERGEIFTLKVKVADEVGANERMRLEIRPPVGAVLGMDRTAPPQIDKVNELF